MSSASTARRWYNDAAAWIDDMVRIYGATISVAQAYGVLISALYANDAMGEAYDDESPDGSVIAPPEP